MRLFRGCYKCLVWVLFVFVLLATDGEAQTMMDIIYLKDGRVFRGEILERTEELLKVRTDDGQIIFLGHEHIAKTERAIVIVQKEKEEKTAPAPVMNFGSVGGMVGDKSPVLASGMSVVIPGSGQLYNGQPIKGAIHFGIAVTGFALVMTSGQSGSGFFAGDSSQGGNKGSIGTILWLGTAVWSSIDAMRTAQRINREDAQAINIQTDIGQITLGIDPVVQPDRIGTVLTLHF